MKSTVTMQDIAKGTGYSVATVSRVINNQGRVSEKAKKIIEQHISLLGFETQSNNRLKRNKKRQTIGVVVSQLDSPFYSLLAQSVEVEAKAKGYHLLVYSSGYDAEGELEAVQSLLEYGCQNIVLYSKAIPDETLKRLCKQYPGIVVICRRIEGMLERCVWLDSSYGIYMATNALLKLGHRSIGFINSSFDRGELSSRLSGYQRAMDEAGILIQPDWIVEVSESDTPINRGKAAARQFISRKMPVTAIIAFNDIYAASAMWEFQVRGFRVPEDVSMVGFDNVMEQCYFHPMLTTLRYPIDEMARFATNLSLSSDKTEAIQQHCFYPTLIHRDSVAASNQSLSREPIR